MYRNIYIIGVEYMRCKAGDLAMIISGGQAGTTLTCLSFLGVDERIKGHDDLWITDTTVTWLDTEMSGHKRRIKTALVADKYLMPINPDSKSIAKTAMDKKVKRKEVNNV